MSLLNDIEKALVSATYETDPPPYSIMSQSCYRAMLAKAGWTPEEIEAEMERLNREADKKTAE